MSARSAVSPQAPADLDGMNDCINVIHRPGILQIGRWLVAIGPFYMPLH